MKMHETALRHPQFYQQRIVAYVFAAKACIKVP
jgi:hypothetical protein